MTSVPNMPGVFSVLLKISIDEGWLDLVSSLLFVRLEHGAFLSQVTH